MLLHQFGDDLVLLDELELEPLDELCLKPLCAGWPACRALQSTLGFVKQGGGWKFNEQTLGPDPTAVTRCKSETAEPRDAYDTGRSVSAGGPIVRVEFKTDYTLVVYSVVGEANCAFLPAKAELAKQKVDPATLVPYAIVTLDGIAHRSDPQKMLADKVAVQPEE